MKLPGLVLVLVLALSLFTFGSHPATAKERPDLLFIPAGDLGWADTIHYGHTALYETPTAGDSPPA